MIFGRKNFNKGQSAVEYLLLFAVMTVVTLTIIGSDTFDKLMGKDSDFFKALKNYMEYTYRYGSPATRRAAGMGDGGKHELYYNAEKGDTRFFSPAQAYPD